MSKIDYQALREAAQLATQGEWVAFISSGTGTYAVHTPGDKRCEDVIKWTCFDGQNNAENNLIDSECHIAELEEALRDKQALLEASEKRIAELEEREILLPERSSMLHRTDFHEDYQTVMAYKVSEVIAAIRAAGIRIKGE
ncbi:ead/Ea22-like family protein [Salmonella enterica subsp. enterica serovar Rubislaw]|nr:ead/Ea22-like family protein [Salmonella enterica]EEO2943450.1 ead/Ea22-like family protein [Salmonella enterica subsp. enterica serovar Rubislaw]EEO4819068.1 ead/Ea22-like family protein [Salmonella enterica subsp. enterica serovar Rubislaw]EEO4855623.1 ead/Ea22-like family protein [Salmonella enterica subsp. enterica serovar Rubislaw]EEO4971929.1 ead/Ea22-like family protein [Salmonella enterica subsp. enterica serovar Rubislaw]